MGQTSGQVSLEKMNTVDHKRRQIRSHELSLKKEYVCSIIEFNTPVCVKLDNRYTLAHFNKSIES